MSIAPVRRTVRTKAPPARTFELFTGRIGRWWPRGRTIGQAPHQDIVIEPRVEGRWFVCNTGGERPSGAKCSSGNRPPGWCLPGS
jgi:hypothetical protein